MRRTDWDLRVADLAVALVAAAAVAALAFSGGSFDVVPRQTAGVVIWWSVGLIAVIGLRLPSRPAVAGAATTALAVGIATWVAVGISSSTSAERSAIELARAVVHLGPIVLVGWALPRRLWRAVIGGITAGLLIVCVAALAERLSPGLLVEGRTVVFENTASRLAAPLGYWNALGSWGVVAAVLLVAVASHAPRAAVRSLALASLAIVVAVIFVTYSRSALAAGAVSAVVLVALSHNRWTAAANLAAVGAAAGAVALTINGEPAIANATGASGAGKVVAAVAVAAAALAGVAALTRRLDAVRLPLRTARIATAVATVVVIVGALGFAATQGQRVWDRFSTTETAVDTADPTDRLTMINNGSRVEQWRVALDSWKADRLSGSGAGTFEFTYNEEARDTQFVRDAHSGFLEALSEQGIIGFGLLVGFVIAAFAAAATAVRRVRGASDRGLVAGATAAMFAFFLGSSADWFWEVTALALVAMTLLGALIAAGSDGGVELEGPSRGEAETEGEAIGGQDTEPRTTRRASWPLRLALLAASALAILILLPGLVGTSEVRRSEEAVQRGDLNAAREHADRAIDTMPWAGSPFLQRGLVDEQAGELESARRALALAIKREPHDWRLPLVLARIEAQAGRPKAALAAYRQAKSLRPRGEFFR